MSAQFTPGPWFAYDGGKRFRAAVYTSTGHVAFCSCRGPGSRGQKAVSVEEMTANARLIAAAPELLAALDQAVTSMQDSGYPNSHPAVRAAREAIAKATGEAS